MLHNLEQFLPLDYNTRTLLECRGTRGAVSSEIDLPRWCMVHGASARYLVEGVTISNIILEIL